MTGSHFPETNAEDRKIPTPLYSGCSFARLLGVISRRRKETRRIIQEVRQITQQNSLAWNVDLPNGDPARRLRPAPNECGTLAMIFITLGTQTASTRSTTTPNKRRNSCGPRSGRTKLHSREQHVSKRDLVQQRKIMPDARIYEMGLIHRNEQSRRGNEQRSKLLRCEE